MCRYKDIISTQNCFLDKQILSYTSLLHPWCHLTLMHLRTCVSTSANTHFNTNINTQDVRFHHYCFGCVKPNSELLRWWKTTSVHLIGAQQTLFQTMAALYALNFKKQLPPNIRAGQRPRFFFRDHETAHRPVIVQEPITTSVGNSPRLGLFLLLHLQGCAGGWRDQTSHCYSSFTCQEVEGCTCIRLKHSRGEKKGKN